MEKGLTQGQLAELAGVSRNCIALLESGSPRANSRLSTLVGIFGAMGFDLKLKLELTEEARNSDY